MIKWSVQCIVCGEKGMFEDAKDIANAKWSILAWDVKTGYPKCVCDKCEYGQPKKDKK